MKRSILLGILAALAVLPLAQIAHAGPDAPSVPTKIAVGEGHKPFLIGHAVGFQIYKCNPVGSSYSWVFVAPRAELYGDNGQLLTTHYAGPKWTAKDGSTVVGARVDGVTVDSSAIPWLLLSASYDAGSGGERLAGTTFIQRIETTGGLIPPAGECHAGTAEEIREVPYTADYVFWKAVD
jgi:Protein of unknown function (DUF3455)